VERGSPGCKLKRDFFLVAPGVMSADTTLRLAKVVRSRAGDPDGYRGNMVMVNVNLQANLDSSTNRQGEDGQLPI
jgi:hypothetical protein